MSIKLYGIAILAVFAVACGQHHGSNNFEKQTGDTVVGKRPADASGQMLEAIGKNDFAKVASLLAGGLDVDQILPNGRTALIEATLQIKVGIAAELLRQKADASLKDSDGKTALDYAKEREIARIWILLDPERQMSTRIDFMKFAGRGSTDKLEELLKNQGADPNFVDESGETPLTFGIRKKKPLGVEVIARWKDPLELTTVDINLPGADGLKPLAVAKQVGQEEIIKLLTALGAQE